MNASHADARQPAQPTPRFARKLLPQACALAMLTAAPLAALAAQEQVELNKMVVSSDWLELPSTEELLTYPGARTLIDSEQLHESGALNLEDALRATPGIQVLDETGTGILPNIGVRGLNPLRSQRAQILVDGYPIAIGPYTNVGVSLFPVTLPSLEAVDVVRGGAAVHYGPNNVGGVLNFKTHPIPANTEQTLRERLVIAEDSGNVFTDTYYRIGGAVTDKLGMQFQANIQSGEGFRDHSDTDVANFIVDAQYFPDDLNELKAQLQYYDVEADLPGGLAPDAYEADRTQSQRPHDGYDADMLRGSLTWTYTPSADTQFEWRNFAHDADRTFFFGQRLGTGDHWADPSLASTHIADSPRLFKVYGTEPRLTHRIGNHTLTVGARYVKEEVEFDVNRLELATDTYSVARDWSFDTEAFAVYVSDSLQLLDNRLTLTPGLRYEDVRTDFVDNKNATRDQNKADELLPGLTLSYRASEQLTLFANGQRSLVPVQTAQVVRDGDVANETAWNYELGARLSPADTFTASATLFRIDYKDQIEYDAGTASFQNLGKTRHEGVELSADWQISPAVSLDLGYTYLDTEIRSGANASNELPNAPEHHLSAGLGYHYQQWNGRLSAVHVSDSFSDSANTVTETSNGSAGKLPSYTLVNAYLSRDFAAGPGRTLNLGLGINNLLDEDYYFRGADVSPVGRVSAPGRSLILEARLDF